MQGANQGKKILDHGTIRQRVNILRLVVETCFLQSINDLNQVAA